MTQEDTQDTRPWYQRPLSEHPDYIGNMRDLAEAVTCPATDQEAVRGRFVETRENPIT